MIQKKKVESLLKLGDLSLLGININPDPAKPHSFEFEERQDGVCVAYGRDRGESNTQAKVLTLKEMFNETWIEYFYIFTNDGKWKYYESNNKNLKDVKQDLEDEYKSIKIKRPKNYYGFWTSDRIKSRTTKAKVVRRRNVVLEENQIYCGDSYELNKTSSR